MERWGPSWGAAALAIGLAIVGIVVLWIVNYWQAFG